MYKKLFLSLGVIGAFSLYSLHVNVDQAEENPVIKPNTSPVALDATSVLSTPIATDTPTPVNTPVFIPTPIPQNTGRYKNGTYTGDVADAFYGNIQVQVTISGGKISDVVFLQYPNDRETSIMINSQAMPLLKQEAIQAQSANIDGVSGATASSGAFVQSLQSALSKAV